MAGVEAVRPEGVKVVFVQASPGPREGPPRHRVPGARQRLQQVRTGEGEGEEERRRGMKRKRREGKDKLHRTLLSFLLHCFLR